MIINIDSDGVMYNLVGHTQELAKHVHGIDQPRPDSWGFDNWDLDFKKIHALWGKSGAFLDGRPVSWSIEVVKWLIGEGHTVRIVTHKHDLPYEARAMRDTITWYERQGLLRDVDLVFPKGNKNDYPADIIIDDKPDLSWAQEGKINLLFDQPWNQGAETKGVIRVHGWFEVPVALKRMGVKSS